MENEEFSFRRPSIGFPLGLALLLILLFCISGVLLCYFNWNNLQTLISGLFYDDDDDDDDIESDFQDSSPVMKPKDKIVEQSLAILMPGDKAPRFIAMACPCQPLTTEKITITVPNPPALPVPFYYS
ncbi:hypothetical protein V6N13_059296 [Hibiscus sabdariffa]|uniref:Hydroxyproline-rich glycoprotein family protein n=1 Tax=Hibiscus sabdariffa TaxID=183260 RepID=A0ABR2GF83_9ROSI